MSGGTIRYIVFMLMALWTGIMACISTPGAVTAAVVAFGYGIDAICTAIEERR